MSAQQQSVAESFAFAHAASPHWRIVAAECVERIGPITGGAFRVLSLLRTPADLAHDPLTIGGALGSFAPVHADPRNSMLNALLAKLSRRLDSGFVVGGLTRSRAAHVQVADGISEAGVSGVVFTDQAGVVFTDQVIVSTRHTQGYSPLGDPHVVTDAQRNVVIELDGRPALMMISKSNGTWGRWAAGRLRLAMTWGLTTAHTYRLCSFRWVRRCPKPGLPGK